MYREPDFLDLILEHLKEEGWQAGGWRGQGSTDPDDPISWITVVIEPDSLFISMKSSELVSITNFKGTIKTLLDPTRPQMFSQLDSLLRKVHGGDPRGLGVNPL